MGELNISNSSTSNMTDNVKSIDIGTTNLDTATLNKTRWTNTDWASQLAIYKKIPEFKIALDMRAIWTVGEKIEADSSTTALLDHITGWGKDTFRNIIKNMIIVKRLGEDAYAEIVRNTENGKLINLKVLDPSTITQIYSERGILTGYEESKTTDSKREVLNTFKPQEIFHLTNKRIGNEIHGTSDSDALKKILEANNESFDDMKLLMHRYVKPMFKFILDTDDEEEIAKQVIKFDKAVNKGENLFIPKGAVEQELIAVPSNSTLNPMPWRDHLRNYFYQVVGMPQIVMGGSGEFSESSAKIAYLAFEISVKDEQVDIMEQVWDQLALRIELKFTKSLMNDMITDEKKDAERGVQAAQPQDTSAGGVTQ